jgi:transposase
MAHTIDPIVLAQFMTLPGAAELIEAYSASPPGVLRQSLVHHAQATAYTYAGVEFEPQPPTGVQPRLAVPQKALATGDPKVRAVELALQGMKPSDVARELGLSAGQVFAAKREAKAAGVTFPAVTGTHGKPKVKGRPAVAYHTSLDTLPHQGLSRVEKAAETRGVTAEAYMARRKLALDMALAGRHIRAIMEATKESKDTLQNWFYQAREAGHALPYMMDSSLVPQEPAPNVIDLKPRRKTDDEHRGRFVLTVEEATTQTGRGNGGIAKGAALMGVSIEEFLRRRRAALALFKEDRLSIPEVAKSVGITVKQAQNWRGRAQRAGVLDLTQVGALRRAHRLPEG